MKTKRSGVTLLEVLIASAILVIVVAITMSILSSGTGTASSGRLMSELEQRGNRTLAFCRDQLSTAAFTQPANPSATPPVLAYTGLGMRGYNGIGYQISGPVTVPTTGLVPAKNVSFGYPNPFSVQNDSSFAGSNLMQPVVPTYACFIRFEADTVYKEGPNAPTPTQVANWTDPALPAFPSLLDDGTGLIVRVLNMDIDGDGSRTTTYVSGKLMKYVIDETQSTNAALCVVAREKLDDQVLMCVNSTAAGDFIGRMDRTLATHYLLAYTDATGTPVPANGVIPVGQDWAAAAAIKVDLWHGCLDQDGKRFILRNNTLLIHFRAELKAGG